MSLKDRLNQDLRAALRSGDEVRKTTLRMLLASVHNAEIQAGESPEEEGVATAVSFDDQAVTAVIAKEAKQRRDSIREYEKAGRQDLVDRETAELGVLSEYMPQQMSRDEIIAAAKRVIEQAGASGPADKGKVMGPLMNELRGRADGREINEVVTELLAQR